MHTDRISEIAQAAGADRAAPIDPCEIVAFKIRTNSSIEIEIAAGKFFIIERRTAFLDLVAESSGREGFAIDRQYVRRDVVGQDGKRRLAFTEAGR